MAFEIEGKLHKVFDIQSKSDTFQTRDIILLVEDGNYPQYIKFQLTQDRCGIADRFKQGEAIKIYFDIRGREWQEKYFTNLNAWKIEPISPARTTDAPMPDLSSAPPEDDAQADPFDELPF